MATESKKSITRGILFFGVCPLLAILGGMFWSDFFVLDTAQHPASWEYTVGPILFFAGLAIFILGLIYANKGNKR
jgi:hypothetical protein